MIRSKSNWAGCPQQMPQLPSLHLAPGTLLGRFWSQARVSFCNRTRQRPGPDNDHTIWLFSGPEISGPHNNHLGGHCLVLKILGPHNDVGKIVRSLSGPETPGPISHGLAPDTCQPLNWGEGVYVALFGGKNKPKQCTCSAAIFRFFVGDWSCPFCLSFRDLVTTRAFPG